MVPKRNSSWCQEAPFHQPLFLLGKSLFTPRCASSLNHHPSQCGQTHWGAEDDVKHLSAKLNIGFLIFRDTLDSEDKQCLVNYHASRGDFPYWMCLWWSEPLHFKLASVQLTRGSTPRCVFLASEVPAPLKTHWTICCPRAPFGEVATGPPEFS